MIKTTLKIDLTKISKDRIRTYTKKDGTEVKEYSIDFVEMDEKKPVTKADGSIIEGDTWILNKVGFVVDTATKEEREAKVKTNIIGDATRFDTKTAQDIDVDYSKDVISAADVPF
jgi:hypothetical protein